MPSRAWCTRSKGTAANVNDVVEANGLLHGDETNVFGDAGIKGHTSALTPRTA
jgi:IS5 family transposase